MKATKKIVGAACALVAAVALSAGTTFAWFAINDTVTATGMQVSASTASALIISSSESFTSAINTVSIAPDTVAELSPTTHIKAGMRESAEASTDITSTSGLCHVKNTSVINPNTGLPLTNPATSSPYTLYYEASSNSGATQYVEIRLFISCKGEALTGKTLKAKMTDVTGRTGTFGSQSNSEMDNIYNAVSVDYWVTNSTSGATSTYYTNGSDVGTTNIKTASTEKTIATGLTIPNVDAEPATGAKKYVEVLMRVYLDGALTVDAGTSTYVNNGALSTDDVKFDIEFTIS